MVDSSTYLPQDVERRQKLAEAMLYGAMKPRTIHNAGEGIAQMAQALIGGIMTRKANEAEASGRKSASDAVARALGGFSAPADSLPQVAPVATPAQPQTISGASPDFTSLYENADKQIGIPGFAERVAQVESSGNPNARNPNSSAGGLYQFIDSTAKQYGLDNKFDPAAATDAFTRLTLDNKAALTKALGREPTAGELYLAHQQGAGGAAKLILAGNTPAASVVGADAANLNGGRGATANDLVDRWTSKFAGMDPASVTSNPVQRGALTPSPEMMRPLGQNADMAALPTAEPAALNRTMPMAQALANPTAPVAIPDNNPLRSNQQQSAGDFARADARRRMAMAMSGGQMPSAPPPMAGNGSPAPIPQPSPAMGAPVQNVPQQAGGSQPNNRLQALIAAAQNPYLTPAQASVLNTAIEVEMKRNAPQKPEIVTAPDGTILAINPMDAAHPQTVYRGGQKPTDDMREYEFAKSQGYPGSFEQYQRDLKKAGASSTNVSTGTVPQGYQNIYDDQGRLIRQEPIPGGPADKSAKDAMRADQGSITSDTILNSAGKIRSIAEKNPSAIGTSGWVLSNSPATDAAEIYREVGVLQSIAAAENINAMRQASPTGGALGNASDADIKLLKDKAGAIDPRSPYFLQQVDDYERTLLRVVNGKEAGDKLFEQSRAPKTQGVGGKTSTGIPWSLEP